LIDIRFFEPSEFNRGSEKWFDLMSVRLLVLLDTFRLNYSSFVLVSPHPSAVGRRDDSSSQHNIAKWGEVRAVDVLPSGMNGRTAMRQAIAMAKEIGLTGIGIYPDWEPSPGLHLDVRQNQQPLDPVLWGGVDDGSGQYYVDVETALKRAGG